LVFSSIFLAFKRSFESLFFKLFFLVKYTFLSFKKSSVVISAFLYLPLDEYQEFQKRLVEYPLIKKDLEYHRKSAKSHQRQMELILRNLEQRNFIEAKDKKLE
jgi:hypothetical protein